MPLSTDILKQLFAELEEAGPFVLASSEDANYFRKTLSTKKTTEKQVEPVVLQVKPPPPLPQVPTLEKKGEEVKEKALLPPSLPPKAPSDFSTVRRILSVVSPELSILDEIPNDEIAVKISERWKTKNQSAPISILLYQEPPEQKALLEQITTAIDIHFGPAKIVHAEKIEKDKQWGAFLSVADLKMVIVCDYTLWQLNQLMEFYKEVPANRSRVLGKVPLFLLPDLSLYLKDPQLKRSLWNALRQKCQPS